MLRRCQAVESLELSLKVTSVLQSNPKYNLKHAHPSTFQKSPCLLHSQRPEILRWGNACLQCEDVAQTRGRKIYKVCCLIKRTISVKTGFHHRDRDLNSGI